MGGHPTPPSEAQLELYGLVQSPEGYYSHPHLKCSTCSPNSCIFITPKFDPKPKTGSSRPHLLLPKCVRCHSKPLCSAVQYERTKPIFQGKGSSAIDATGTGGGRKEGDKEKGGKEISQRGKYRFYPPRLPGESMVRKMEDQDEQSEQSSKKQKIDEQKRRGNPIKSHTKEDAMIKAFPATLLDHPSVKFEHHLPTSQSIPGLSKESGVRDRKRDRSLSLTPVDLGECGTDTKSAGTSDATSFTFPVSIAGRGHHHLSGGTTVSTSTPRTYARAPLRQFGGFQRSLFSDSEGEIQVQVKPDPDVHRQKQQGSRNNDARGEAAASLAVEDRVKTPFEQERTSESYASGDIDILTDSSSYSPFAIVKRNTSSPARPRPITQNFEARQSSDAMKGPGSTESFASHKKENMKHETAVVEARSRRVEQKGDTQDHIQCLETLTEERLARLEAEKKVVQLESDLRRKEREVRAARAEIKELKAKVVKQKKKEEADKKWRCFQDLAMSNNSQTV